MTYFCEICNMDHAPWEPHADSAKQDVEDEPDWE